MNNVLTMAFLNVTNLKNSSDSSLKEFTRPNSHVGKQFPLVSESDFSDPVVDILGVNQFLTSLSYGDYLPDLPFGLEPFDTTLAMPGDEPLHGNPFNLSTAKFDSASKATVFSMLEFG